MIEVAAAVPTPKHEQITRHLERVAPLLVANFGSIPLVYASYPDGLSEPAVFHRAMDTAPATIPTVAVATPGGTHRYVTLSEHNVAWLTHGKYAVELYSWSPIATDPERAAYARILLEPSGTATTDNMYLALHHLDDLLTELKLAAVPVQDGGSGYALWIPCAGGPTYPEVAAFCHAFAAEAVRRNPELLTTENLLRERGNRIYLGVKSNHPGMMSILPYSCRGDNDLSIALPRRFSQIVSGQIEKITTQNFATWLSDNGDLFTKIAADIAPQNLPSIAADPSVAQFSRVVSALTIINDAAADIFPAGSPLPRTPLAQSTDEGPSIIDQALQVLADGKPRTAETILADGLAAGLFDASVTRKHVYTDLYEYVMRTLGSGRTPDIIQDETTREFRINHAVDTWPTIALPAPQNWIDDTDRAALIAAVQTSSTGDDPTQFEVAVCNAFNALGFIATHYGGNAAPDGTLDAPLGPLAYRVILECKTAKPGGVVSNPRAEEPASFRDGYHAQKALLIGPAFSTGTVLQGELQTHAVALWTTDDLVAMLNAAVGPHELLPALEAGIAKGACDAILWERQHGRRKHLAVLCQSIQSAGWRAQQHFATTLPSTDVPRLTAEALYLLVDTELIAAGVTPGATRADYESALAILVNSGSLIANPVAESTSSDYIVTHPPTA